jgi:hypothetical protein
MKWYFVIGFLWIATVGFCQSDSIAIVQHPPESSILLHNNYEELFRTHFDFGLTSLNANHTYLQPSPLRLCNPFMSGMFCTIENRIESISSVAPRFRLGSLNYTDWMEGKKEYYMRYWK